MKHTCKECSEEHPLKELRKTGEGFYICDKCMKAVEKQGLKPKKLDSSQFHGFSLLYKVGVEGMKKT